MISFQEAFQLTLEKIQPLGQEMVSLADATDRIASQQLEARVWSPTADCSLKDGFAVHSMDVEQAAPDHKVALDLVGSVAAGGNWRGKLQRGQAVRILSGAPLPDGAEAVLAEEFARLEEDQVIAFNTARPGRNVLSKGQDVFPGAVLVQPGEKLRPTMIGYLASAGYAEVPVIRRPVIGLIATGDEVIAPGKPLPDGKLYASNLVTLTAWCRRYGFMVETDVLPDHRETLLKDLKTALESFDAVITSGGAWKGDRDLVVDVLEELGWEKLFHRVKMGPGKAVGFGLFGTKPVFCLPGGPPSNHMAFLQLALPGLMKLAGWKDPGLPSVPVRLGQTLRGQQDWTQFIHGRITEMENCLQFVPLEQKSRLQMLSRSDAVVKIPKGVEEITEGETLMAALLS